MKESQGEEKKACRCPYCDAELAEETVLCVATCEVVIVECANCGKPVREGAEECPSCGEQTG